MAMAGEASSSCKSKTQESFAVRNDVVAADHQQHRDEGGDDHQKKKEEEEEERGKIEDEEEDVDQTRSLNDDAATCAKINEIFGNDEVVVVRRMKKHKKYRSLQSIYMDTMPIIVEADSHRIRYRGQHLN